MASIARGRVWFAAVFAFALAAAMMAGPSGAWAAEDSSLTVGSEATATPAVKPPVKKATVAFTKQKVKVAVDNAGTKVVNNGKYTIALKTDTTKRIALKKGRAIAAPANAATAKWKFSFEKSAQAYFITNAKTGKALTAKMDGGKLKSGAFVYQKTLKKSSMNQRWKITATSTGYILKSAANTKLALSVDKTGKAVMSKSGSGKVRKFWLLGASGLGFLKSGTYSFSTKSGKLLSVPGMSIKKNKRLKVAGNSGNLGQVFDVTYLSSGYYRIDNVNSSMALTAAAKGAVVQRAYKAKPAQKWKAVLLADGSVRFVNKKTKRALDVTASGLACNLPVNAKRLSQGWTVSPNSAGINVVGKRALRKANTRKSKTKYCVVVDLTMHEAFVFEKVNPKKSGGPWKLIRTNRCSSGSRSHWSSAGDSYVTSQHFRHMGFNCFYFTISRRGPFIHSVLYASNRYPNRVTDGRMGQYISHGCIRMPTKDAKWIYDHCGKGTATSRYY